MFIVLEDPLQAIGEEKSSEVMQLWPLHSITWEGLLDKICLLIKQWQRYSGGYQYLFYLICSQVHDIEYMPGTGSLVKILWLGGYRPMEKSTTDVLLIRHVINLSSKYLS